MFGSADQHDTWRDVEPLQNVPQIHLSLYQWKHIVCVNMRLEILGNMRFGNVIQRWYLYLNEDIFQNYQIRIIELCLF